MSQINYAFRNKKTGMWFRGGSIPSKEPRLYTKKPSASWLPHEWSREKGHYIPRGDWEIVKFSITEVGTEEIE